MSGADDVALAVDVGGTKLAAALVDRAGRLLAEVREPTPRSEDAETVAAGLDRAITRLARAGGVDAARIVGVGVGSAGPVDVPGGRVSPVNIGAWRGFDLVGRVERAVGRAFGRKLTVTLAGDGPCIALGEHWLGAGRDVDSMIGMVVSTGVGGGVVVGRTLFGGVSGNAVHVGHISVNAWGERCVCGCHGCVEMYASGPAMVARARREGLDVSDGQGLTAAARAGDPVALAAFDHGTRALAAGVAATVTTLDVPVVVLGGGMARAGEVLFAPLRRHLREFATLGFTVALDLRAAELDNAGLLGAARLGFDAPTSDRRGAGRT